MLQIPTMFSKIVVKVMQEVFPNYNLSWMLISDLCLFSALFEITVGMDHPILLAMYFK